MENVDKENVLQMTDNIDHAGRNDVVKQDNDRIGDAAFQEESSEEVLEEPPQLPVNTGGTNLSVARAPHDDSRRDKNEIPEESVDESLTAHEEDEGVFAPAVSADPSAPPTLTAEAVGESGNNVIAQRPVKRARTAYFIFAEEKRLSIQKEHPGEGVAAVARALGQIWASMPAEEKSLYQQKAAEERERVAKDMEAWKAAGGVAEVPESKRTSEMAGSSLILPVARIRKICKLDPEVRGVSKEALLLITKAAELATASLGLETVRVAQIQNRRKILPEDVAQVCQTREQFLFLRDDIQDLARQQKKQAAEASASNNLNSKSSKAPPTDKDGKPHGKPLTDFFCIRPK